MLVLIVKHVNFNDMNKGHKMMPYKKNKKTFTLWSILDMLTLNQTLVFESVNSDHTGFTPMTSGSQDTKNFPDWTTGTNFVNF